MKTRHLFILLILLVVVAFALSFLNQSESKSDKYAAVLTQPEIAKVNSIEIYEGDTPKIIAKLNEKLWKIENANNFPLNFPMLSQLVDTLKTTKVLRSFQTNETRLEKLQLGKEKIIFKSNDEIILEILIGKTAKNGGTFIKNTKQSDVLLIEAMIDLETDPKAWTQHQILGDFSTSQVQKIEIIMDKEKCSLERDTASTNFIEENALIKKEWRQDTISTLLNNLISLRYIKTSPIDSIEVKESMVNPKEFQISDFDGNRVKIKIAKKRGEQIENSDGKKQSSAVYAIIEFTPTNPSWDEACENFAFEISNFIYQKLANNIEELFSETI